METMHINQSYTRDDITTMINVLRTEELKTLILQLMKATEKDTHMYPHIKLCEKNHLRKCLLYYIEKWAIQMKSRRSVYLTIAARCQFSIEQTDKQQQARKKIKANFLQSKQKHDKIRRRSHGYTT
jgi:hypothetical protein